MAADHNKRILWANQAVCDSVGLPRKEVLGAYCYEIWSKQKEARPECPVVKGIQTETMQEGERSAPDGRNWFIRGYPVKDFGYLIRFLIHST